MTRAQVNHLLQLLEAIKSRHAQRHGKNYGDRTLREVQTYEDICEALQILTQDTS